MNQIRRRIPVISADQYWTEGTLKILFDKGQACTSTISLHASYFRTKHISAWFTSLRGFRDRWTDPPWEWKSASSEWICTTSESGYCKMLQQWTNPVMDVWYLSPQGVIQTLEERFGLFLSRIQTFGQGICVSLFHETVSLTIRAPILDQDKVALIVLVCVHCY